MAGVQQPEAVLAALHLQVGVHEPVDQDRVAEHLGHNRRVGRWTSWLVWGEVPAVRLVDVRVPQVAGARLGHHRRPRRVALLDALGDEDLVLEHQVDGPRVQRPRKMVHGDQGQLVVVVDHARRRDARIGVEPSRADRVVVVPDEARPLVVRVVVLSLVTGHVSARPQDLIVDEAGPFVAVGIPPGVRPAVAGPGDQAAMKVHGGPVVLVLRAHDRPVDRQDVAGRKVVSERDLDGSAPLGRDDPAEVPERLGTSLTVAPQPRRVGQVRMELVGELANPDGVVGDPRLPPGLRVGIRLGDRHPRTADAAQRLDELAEPVAPGVGGDRRYLREPPNRRYKSGAGNRSCLQQRPSRKTCGQHWTLLRAMTLEGQAKTRRREPDQDRTTFRHFGPWPAHRSRSEPVRTVGRQPDRRC